MHPLGTVVVEGDHGVHARLVLQGTPALHCSSKTAT